MRIDGGPRIGHRTLEAILCDAKVETIATTGTGELIDLGGYRPLPPKVRRTVLNRDGSHCVIDGCQSRYRPEVHHIQPRELGGDSNPGDAATHRNRSNQYGPSRDGAPTRLAEIRNDLAHVPRRDGIS